MRTPRLHLLFYGLPGLPLAALGLPLYIYLPTFYAEQLGLGLALVGAILLLARATDVLSDPLIGLLADRIPFRARRKTLMLLAMPLLSVSIWALFVPPDTAAAGWLLGWSLLVYLGWSLLVLPYTAWGAELSADYDERSAITGSREGFVLAGTLLAAGLPFAFGIGSDAPGSALSLLATMLLLLLPLTVVLALWRVPETPARARPISLRQGLPLLRENPLFTRLLLAYLLNGIANGLPATLFLLYVTHVLAMPEQFGLLLLVYFASGLIGLPVGLKLARRFSKHRVWSVSMLWAAAVFVWVPLLGQGDLTAFLLICLLTGLSLGIDMALPASIQADIVDIDSANGGGQRTGFFFGVWGMTTKLALALAVGLAFPLLDWSGFAVDGAVSRDPWALALLYGLLPIPFKLAAAALMWSFALGRSRQRSLQHLLRTQP